MDYDAVLAQVLALLQQECAQLAIVAGPETEYLLRRRYRSVLGGRDRAPKTRVRLNRESDEEQSG